MKVLASLSLLGFLLTACDNPKSNSEDTTEAPPAKAPVMPIANKPEQDIDPVQTHALKYNKPEVVIVDHSPPPPVPKGGLPDPLVGRGFSTLSLNQMAYCLDGTISNDSSANQSVRQLQSVSSFSALQSALFGGTYVSWSFLGTEFEQVQNFFEKSAEAELWSSYNFAAGMIVNTKRIDNIQFRDDVPNPFTNPSVFLTACGNRFIASSIEGGMFVANVKLQFTDVKTKELISTVTNITNLLSELRDIREKLTETQMGAVVMKISTLQIGGDLASAYAPTGITCNLANLKSCEAVLANITKYAEMGFAEGVLRKPASLSVQLNPYHR